MRYGLTFLTLAVILTTQAAARGGTWWLLIWPAASFAVVAAGYLGLGYRVFGKQNDGTRSWLAMVVLLPYSLLTLVGWHLMRFHSRQAKFDKLVPNILIGRRLLAAEVPVEIQLIVDLTCEFPESAAVRDGRRYLSVPMLDSGVGNEDAFVAAARDIAATDRNVYIHCAYGFGRTGTMAAAVLIAKGWQRSVEDAVTQVQSARPGVRLSRIQRRLLEDICDRLLENGESPSASSCQR